ncbi:helix-turn-helix domain-containing protein [Massilia sp. 9096]|uniref:winged helix-turn-helix transcriptional regulator n=1 Tax=Massilia sp. 9096 TaxID=1500894 RepID=UPI00055D02E1|nr:helix-turn-helix domain-containing protein [Massilia sp. 9096]
MVAQEGTKSKPGEQKDPATCEHLSRMLARICDKWTLLVVRTLGRGPRRFNALRKDIGEISQKMLAQTLRDLEENGFVTRTVTPVKPPQVEYALTELGENFLSPVRGLAEWVAAHSDAITAARGAFAQSRTIK